MIPGWKNFPKEANTGHIRCCLWTVVSIAQLPRLPSIVTHFQVITKVCEDVNEVVQLIHLLSWDVTCTIDQLEKKQENQTRRKKAKAIRNVTQKSAIFMFVQMSSISGTSGLSTLRKLVQLSQKLHIWLLLRLESTMICSHKYHFFMRWEIFTVIFPRWKLPSFQWISPEIYPYYIRWEHILEK